MECFGLTNNKLSSVNIKKVVGSDETITAHYTITESSNTLSVKDEIKNHYFTYTFNNNQVVSIIDSYDFYLIDSTLQYHETTLDYSATTTTVTDIFGKVTKYYFSNGLPTMIYDDL